MSLCLEHGHVNAERYTLGRLHDEAALIQERHNGTMLTENNLLTLAVHSLLSKRARKEHQKMIKKLNVETKPQGVLY